MEYKEQFYKFFPIKKVKHITNIMMLKSNHRICLFQNHEGWNNLATAFVRAGLKYVKVTFNNIDYAQKSTNICCRSPFLKKKWGDAYWPPSRSSAATAIYTIYAISNGYNEALCKFIEVLFRMLLSMVVCEK